VGVVSARAVQMTAIPQMVALFNGVGGGAAALIAAAEFHRQAPEPGRLAGEVLVGILFSAVIGSVSFWGSLVAFGKLQELITGRPLVFPGQNVFNALLGAALVALVVLTAVTENGIWIVLLMVGAAVLGVLFVLPIGGADMPVVISLLNACTGLAAASTGFVLDNTALIIGGTLVGASGTLLTIKMGQAMGRPLAQTLFGAFGSAPATAVAAGPAGDGASVRTASPDDIGFMLAYARRVVFVPGYGLAVAQAQHDVRSLGELLEGKGVDVRYAIHPVAGRMPGHMNVLLAEANVPYDELFEMDEINPEFPQTDVVVVVGANDVVNPAARNQPGNPIYGMPILDVDKAHNVVVIKRSLATGFAGVDNPLFYDPKTVMLFGDAKSALEQLVSSVKAV
jgi:proton-translocating NAD(P)+ transhydrogenase subunit beta